MCAGPPNGRAAAASLRGLCLCFQFHLSLYIYIYIYSYRQQKVCLSVSVFVCMFCFFTFNDNARGSDFFFPSPAQLYANAYVNVVRVYILCLVEECQKRKVCRRFGVCVGLSVFSRRIIVDKTRRLKQNCVCVIAINAYVWLDHFGQLPLECGHCQTTCKKLQCNCLKVYEIYMCEYTIYIKKTPKTT